MSKRWLIGVSVAVVVCGAVSLAIAYTRSTRTQRATKSIDDMKNVVTFMMVQRQRGEPIEWPAEALAHLANYKWPLAAPSDQPSTGRQTSMGMAILADFRHEGGIVVGFTNGHAKWIEATDPDYARIRAVFAPE